MDQPISPNPLAQIEKAYDTDIKVEDIMQNPVLKPISDICPIYKGQSLLIAKELSDYDSTKEKIDELFKINSRYSGTLIGALVQRLIYLTSDIILNQDIQRLEFKKAMNEMLVIVQGSYCLREEGDMINNTTDVSKIFEGMLDNESDKKIEKIVEKLK